MERYKDHKKWIEDYQKIQNDLEKLRTAAPLYYEFYKKFINSSRKNFMEERNIESQDSFSSQIRKVNVLKEYVRRWMDFPYKESQNIWELVKKHNSYGGDDKINTKEIYGLMKQLKANNQ